MSKDLIIVESPAKVKTIKKFLGKDYQVEASVGHVRDLPKGDLGVDEERDFAPKYQVIPGKQKVVSALKAAAEEVVRTVHEMAHSVSEQSTVSTQIAQRIEAISLASEDNRRAVDEAVGATQRVNTLAHQLTDSVRVFRLPA